MNEKALVFGETNNLIGILSLPESFNRRETRPALIFLNAGVIHRVGPHRLYVRLARAMADAGFISLRFDLSGIGDSAAATSVLDYKDRVLTETKQAMNVLASTEGVNRFILIGLCSGANNSVRVACSDERVIGAALIDTYFYVSTGFRLRDYCNRISDPAGWGRFLTGKSEVWQIFSRVFSLQRSRSNPAKLPTVRRKMKAELRALREKNIPLLLIYTRNNYFFYKYRRIVKRTLALRSANAKVHIKYFDQCDHTFTLLASQRSLLVALREWIQGTTQSLTEASISSTRSGHMSRHGSLAYSNETD
jgi:hypothetical protein